jgi:Flp pilus assembly protein TadG
MKLLRRATDPTPGTRTRPRGQILVIFALGIFVLMMMVAVVIDVSWLWVNALRIQRAADAAALAGAVTLPNDPSRGYTLARGEATKNGYTGGGGVTVTPLQDSRNTRRLNVTITAPVNTFFMRLVGFNQLPVTRRSSGEFTLPVPMGSPQNYYGVGLLNLPVRETVTTVNHGDTGWRVSAARPSSPVNGGTWATPANADATVNTSYSTSATNGAQQQWTSFGLQGGSGPVPNDPTLVIEGIEFRLRALMTGSGTNTGCQIETEVSWGNGAAGTWSSPTVRLPSPALSTTKVLYPLGSASSTADWPHAWSYSNFSNTNFRVRLTAVKPGTCTRTIAVDTLEVRISYRTSTTSVIVLPPSPQPVIAPDGTVLAPQFFWGAMQSQGAPAVQGDAHMTGYTTRKSVANPKYDPNEFYNYGVELPAGSSSGQVWIFDPGFCDTAKDASNNNQGTGENWTVGGANGNATVRPISAFYELYSTANTPYDRGDDTLVASSGNTFRRLSLSDPFLGGRSDAAGSCDGTTSWHNQWWQLASGLPAGTYRLHTASKIQSDTGDDQTDSTGLNAFAVWSKATGGTPRVYGLGAMEAYFPLPAGQPSTFYLAQIEAPHAGKWMDIDLWDPGDTGSLIADLEILTPTGGGYTPATFYVNTISGTTIPSTFTCGPSTSTARTIIRTNTGSSNIYNGFWVRLCVHLADTYSAPTPPGETEPGWWKIRYTMGAGSNASTDLTTWKVSIRGNPVHLVIP